MVMFGILYGLDLWNLKEKFTYTTTLKQEFKFTTTDQKKGKK